LKRCFADTGYWIALANSRDQHHKTATEASERLGSFLVVTSEFVILELLNYFSGKGGLLRAAASQLVDALRSDPNTQIVPATSSLFEEAYNRWKERKDKKWSLVDCSSFIIMGRQGLDTALTFDKHYKQQGFLAPLLR